MIGRCLVLLKNISWQRKEKENDMKVVYCSEHTRFSSAVPIIITFNPCFNDNMLNLTSSPGSFPVGEIARFNSFVIEQHCKQFCSKLIGNSEGSVKRSENIKLVFLVGYVEERLGWPIQIPNKGRKKANS